MADDTIMLNLVLNNKTTETTRDDTVSSFEGNFMPDDYEDRFDLDYCGDGFGF